MHMLFNSFRPSDATWRHRTGSTLAQVMACCLTAPSHYLNQCWIVIIKAQCHSSEDNSMKDTSAIKHKIIAWKLPKIWFISPRGQWVNGLSENHCIWLGTVTWWMMSTWLRKDTGHWVYILGWTIAMYSAGYIYQGEWWPLGICILLGKFITMSDGHMVYLYIYICAYTRLNNG